MHSSRYYTGILMLLILLLPDSIQSQNLVRNCDLESRLGCPTGHGQLEYCQYWASPGDGTSDYLNSCNTGNFSTPTNQFGFQHPMSGGAYAHLISYYPQSGQYREYMQNRLACELQAGKSYAISFYVSCSDDSRYSIDALGAHFTIDPLVQNSDDVIDLGEEPHISNTPGEVLDDKDDWMEVRGIYVAQGGEKYITIGNFKYNNELTLGTFTNWNTRFASYYVDDISVYSVEPIISLGNDTTICPNDSILFDFRGICSNAELYWENGSDDMLRWIKDDGYYYLSGEIGCSDFWSDINIHHSPDPGKILPPDTVICTNNTVELIPTDNFSSYEWQDGSDQPTYLADTEGVYWLNVMNTHGCAYSDTLLLMGLDEPLFYLGNDTLICLGKEVLLDPGIDSAFHYFLWSDYSTGTTLTVADSGEYWVEIKNPCGEMTDYIFIHTQNCNPAIAAPNAFTPNGDGLNDTFVLQAENISNFRMLIYDRWGTLLFETTELDLGWDGTIKGSNAPVGTYVWLAVYDIRQEDNSFKTEKMKGTLVLLQ